MLRPLKYPNLPEHRVHTVIYGSKNAHLLAEPLQKIGIQSIFTPECRSIDPRLSGHSDMILHHLGGEQLVISADTYNNMHNYVAKFGKTWLDIDFLKSNSTLSPDYPNDILFNSLQMRRYLFAHLSHTDVRIITYCNQNSIKCINVHQGYVKCSVCVVDERAVITADKGIANVMRNEGFDVLEIAEGFIDLPGFEYGFIGGASGKIARDEIAFTGTLDHHPDYNRMLQFLDSRSVKPIFLTQQNCFDIGSILPLFEYDD